MEGGPPEFPQDSTCPVVLGNPTQGVSRIYPTGLSPSVVRLSRRFGYARDLSLPVPTAIGAGQAPRPRRHNACGLSRDVGLGCSLFARRYWGNRGCFLFLRVLRCFSSPRWPPAPMDSAQDLPRLVERGCPIRESPDWRLCATTRGLSQLTTPFIACWCQGIHRIPLVA